LRQAVGLRDRCNVSQPDVAGGTWNEKGLHPLHGSGWGAQLDVHILLLSAKRDFGHGRTAVDRAQFLANLRGSQTVQQRPGGIDLHIDQR
jgi:hypothetical protein